MSEAANTSSPINLQKTPLHALHIRLGARMVPFAGYEMPVQYPLGVLKEHLHTRASAGLFDVSHMGQIALRAKSGRLADAATALESLVPADILSLACGRQRYGLFTEDAGGILDDLMIAARDDHLLLIVNAACKDADEAHLRAALAEHCEIEKLNRALIALQGPEAGLVLGTLAPKTAAMRFMDVRDCAILGASCIVSRSGYTGEDGFEISLPIESAEEIATELLKNPVVQPIGLGARDSLRLEAGLPLHGADIDPTTTPLEASLGWAIAKSRRVGGVRAGGYPGASAIDQQFARGTARRLVGLAPQTRTPVRAETPLFADETTTEPIGAVTSGGFGPSVNAPIAVGYLPAARTAPGTIVFAEVRGNRLPVSVVSLPFVPHRYKRQ